jgi:type IV secretion system protein VirB8
VDLFMPEQDHKLAESIRNGDYFREARAWYKSMYIGPIAERTFFIMIALASLAVGLTYLVALSLLMPIVAKPPIILPAREGFETYIPRIVPLRAPQEAPSKAVLQFYIANYVVAREGYSVETWQSSANAVRSQSDEATYVAYVYQRHPENSASLAAKLGREGSMLVEIESVRLQQNSEVPSARVVFSNQTKGVTPESKTRWTAELKYRYKEIGISTVSDPKTGRDTIAFEDPQFQVLSYEVQPAE